MKYEFCAYGHPNILAKHKITLEFTKDSELSLKGDCIVGIKSDFDLEELKHFIKKSSESNNNKITITIKTKNNNIEEKISAKINNGFNSSHELIIRKSDFVSDRTLAIKADKAAFELDKRLIRFLKDKKTRVRITIENKSK